MIEKTPFLCRIKLHRLNGYSRFDWGGVDAYGRKCKGCGLMFHVMGSVAFERKYHGR